MPKPTKLTIDTISKDDVRDIFQNICEEYMVQPAYEVKKTHLKFKGNQNSLMRAVPTIHDVLTLCTNIGLKFSITVEYDRSVLTTKEIVDKKLEGPPDLNNGVPFCDTYNKLEKQKAEITNPDLQDLIDAHVPAHVVIEEKEEIKPPIPKMNIPDFKI